jgi:hypothetical protein
MQQKTMKVVHKVSDVKTLCCSFDGTNSFSRQLKSTKLRIVLALANSQKNFKTDVLTFLTGVSAVTIVIKNLR